MEAFRWVRAGDWRAFYDKGLWQDQGIGDGLVAAWSFFLAEIVHALCHVLYS
jgi:hypothetical protein